MWLRALIIPGTIFHRIGRSLQRMLDLIAGRVENIHRTIFLPCYSLFVKDSHSSENLMTRSSTPRLVCLVYPIGSGENHLLNGDSSLSIIASEQYILMKRYLYNWEILLYKHDVKPLDQDILLVMTCLPLVSEDILKQFSKIVYFFDDLDIWKMNIAEYRKKLKYLSGILHPVRNVAQALGNKTSLPSSHMSWSLARVPATKSTKSRLPTFFVDMDDRAPYVQSLDSGFAFIRAIEVIKAAIYIPEQYFEKAPKELQYRITPLPWLEHEDFLRFLQKTWFYVSGIPGSYEFPVLESSFMGCGLISLNHAILDEHTSRSFFLDFTSEPECVGLLRAQLDSFNPNVIMCEAYKRYPQTSISKMPTLLAYLV